MRTRWPCHSATDIHEDTEISYCSNYTKILPAFIHSSIQVQRDTQCSVPITLQWGAFIQRLLQWKSN